MLPTPRSETDDPNNPQSQSQSSTKVRNIILVNNASPGSVQDPPDNVWQGGLFSGSKLPNNGAAFIAEAFQKQGIGSQYNFNAGICPEFDSKKDYYKEFWRVYLQNEIILIDMKDFVVDIKNLQEQIKKVEEHHKTLETAKQQALKEKGAEKKKNRRPASEIQKNHLCPYESCNKFYGSEVSLNLHIKLKHQGGNKTDREKLAISIVKAKMSGEELPELNLNLPPGFLETYQTQIQMDSLFKTEQKMEASFESQNISMRKTSGLEIKMEIPEKNQFSNNFISSKSNGINNVMANGTVKKNSV